MSKKLRLSQITLLLYLAVVFNLERLEWRAGIQGVGIHTFLYGMVAAAIAIMYFLPYVKRLSLSSFLLGWSVIYFSLRLTLFADSPVYGGIYTFITVTELVILLIAIALAYINASELNNYEKFVEDVYLPNLGKRIHKQEAVTEEIKTEFIRSRRHQLPLSLLVIRSDVSAKMKAVEVNKVFKEVQSRMTKRFMTASLAKVIVDEVRRTDLIISGGDDGPFFVLCLDTKMDGSIKLAERIQSIANQNLGIPVSFGVASFPEEALTYDELVHQAELHLMQNEASATPVIEAESSDHEVEQKDVVEESNG
jgi:GGDEF domain-containing protein